MRSGEERASVEAVLQIFQLHQSLGLPVGGRKFNRGGRGAVSAGDFRQLTDQFVRPIDSGLGLGGARFRSAAQPLDFRAHPVGKGILPLGLGFEKGFFLLQKRAVVPVDAQQPIRIGAVQLHRFRAHVFQKVPVVADHDAGERCGIEQAFQPLDAAQIQMIGGLIQQQNIGLLHQRLGNRQALAPATGKAGCIDGKILKARSPQCFADASFPLGRRRGDALKRSFENRAHGGSGRKFGLLRNVAQPRALAGCHLTAVRFDLAGENAQQRRLARTVGSDQSDARALFNREGDVAQKGISPK